MPSMPRTPFPCPAARRETLTYAALLRLPRHMSHAAKTERVDVVLTALGLQGCSETIIGEARLGAASPGV